MRHFFVALALILISTLLAHDVQASLSEFFPPELSLGMSTNALVTSHPTVLQSKVSLFPQSDGTDPLFTEYIERLGPTTYRVYLATKGRVVGVLYSEAAVVDNKDGAHILTTLKSQAEFHTKTLIARAGGSLDLFPATATLWKLGNGESVYFISTSQETSLILFDSHVLNFKNFFIEAERIPALQDAIGPVRPTSHNEGDMTSEVVDFLASEDVLIAEKIHTGEHSDSVGVLRKSIDHQGIHTKKPGNVDEHRGEGSLVREKGVLTSRLCQIVAGLIILMCVVSYAVWAVKGKA